MENIIWRKKFSIFPAHLFGIEPIPSWSVAPSSTSSSAISLPISWLASAWLLSCSGSSAIGVVSASSTRVSIWEMCISESPNVRGWVRFTEAMIRVALRAAALKPLVYLYERIFLKIQTRILEISFFINSLTLIC